MEMMVATNKEYDIGLVEGDALAGHPVCQYCHSPESKRNAWNRITRWIVVQKPFGAP